MKINKEKTRRKVLHTFATEVDVKHPTILRMAYVSGEISQDEMQQILQLEDIKDYDVSPYLLAYILENYFGFEWGQYEESFVEGYQETRIPSLQKVKECKRYTGYERLDKDWIESGLASKDAVELYRYGEILVP